MQAEEHQTVLLAELNHRVKNMLAAIIFIVRTSMGTKGVEPVILEAFTDRLHGMARAYALLPNDHGQTWGSATSSMKRWHLSTANVSISADRMWTFGRFKLLLSTW